MEVDTLSVDFVSKVNNVQINNRGPSTDPCGTEQQRHMCVMYYRRTRREMFYPTGMTGTIPVRCHANQTGAQVFPIILAVMNTDTAIP